MLFNSIDYLLFFLVVFSGYHIIPRRFRYIWLLAGSYYFYAHWNATYTLLMLGMTIVSYGAAWAIERYRTRRALRKTILWGTIVACFGLLVYFKYTNFLISNINDFLSAVSVGAKLSPMDILLPVGISFYTFQAAGYVIDVYRGDSAAEKNPLRYALFVSFFPQLVAGPIERSKNLLHQLVHPHPLTPSRFREGLLFLLVGLWQKVVIADNIAELINPVFHDHAAYPGSSLFLATLAFGIQIYCDFAGYSNMAIGSAKLLGVDLMNNFSAPYLAISVPDFWRRWHISLTSWLKDYLYIPLGGNRKGEARKYLNILIVFLVSGIWHGAERKFIIWGLLNGLLIVLSNLRARHLPDSRSPSTAGLLRKRLLTFLLISFTWLFFRASGIVIALRMLKQMVFSFDLPSLLDKLSISFLGDVKFLALTAVLTGIPLLFLIDVLKNRYGQVIPWLSRRNPVLRWGLYAILILQIVILGAYGGHYVQTKFIYFQF